MIVQGWKAQPDGRGTLDIISQSLTTIFLCCWSALCLNVPAPTWSRWKCTVQKALMTCMGLIGPEFVFQLALGQWVSARRSVAAFKESGYPDWTMRHAFLADMGGFVFHHPASEDFPLTAKQVHYLVTQGYVEYAAVGLDRKFIDDRNKGDATARFITVCQMLWFSVNCFGRVAQGLAITTIELTTLGFIVCTLGTYFFWARKPMDVINAIALVPNVSLQKILEKAGDEAKEAYYCTPLDFIGRELSPWALYWTYWVNILGKFCSLFRHTSHKIRDDNFLPISSAATFVLFLSQIAYAAIHICGWNIHFPTATERLLWRISSLAIMVSILSYWLVEGFTWRIHPAIKNYIDKRRARVHGKDLEQYSDPDLPQTRYQKFAAKLRNNSNRDDHALDVPLKAILPMCMLGAFYCTSRAYILLEDLLSLRALPATAYQSIDWSGFIPHF